MNSAAGSQTRHEFLLHAFSALRHRLPAMLRRVLLLTTALAGAAALFFATALLSAHRAEMIELRAMAKAAAGGATGEQALFVNVMKYVHVNLRNHGAIEDMDRNAWVRKPGGLLGGILSASPAANRFVQSFHEPTYESFLKPSAVQIFVQGSDCAGASRLMVLLLDLLGIDAYKLGIHDAKGVPMHAVVSGRVDGRWVVADPLHGYVYPLEDGRLATAEDIARRPVLATRFLKPKENPIIAEYRYVRTLNWLKIPVVMPLAYVSLRAVIGDRVDHVGRPLLVEQPKVLSAILFTGIGLTLLLPALAMGLPRPAWRRWAHRPVEALLARRLAWNAVQRKI